MYVFLLCMGASNMLFSVSLFWDRHLYPSKFSVSSALNISVFITNF